MSRLFSGTPFDRPAKCSRCGKLPTECRCIDLPEKKKMSKPGGPAPVKLDSGLVLSPENSFVPKDQVAKVRIEKRKGGRSVTVISGMDHPANALPKLCTELKQALSVGGSVQGRTVEVQGEHADRVLEMLTSRGLKARIV